MAKNSEKKENKNKWIIFGVIAAILIADLIVGIVQDPKNYLWIAVQGILMFIAAIILYYWLWAKKFKWPVAIGLLYALTILSIVIQYFVLKLQGTSEPNLTVFIFQAIFATFGFGVIFVIARKLL